VQDRFGRQMEEYARRSISSGRSRNGDRISLVFVVVVVLEGGDKDGESPHKNVQSSLNTSGASLRTVVL